MLTDFAEIWVTCLQFNLKCWCRISLKSDVVCQSYGNVYSVIVFSWTRCRNKRKKEKLKQTNIPLFCHLHRQILRAVLPFQYGDQYGIFVYLHRLHTTLTGQASPHQTQHYLCLGCLQQYYIKHTKYCKINVFLIITIDHHPM